MLKISKTIAAWTAAAASVCLLAIMVLTFVDVVGRYLFDNALPYTVELVQLGMGLVVFLGLALTTLEKGHISVDVLTSMLPASVGGLLARFGFALSALFFGLIAWWLFERGLSFRKDGLTTDVLLLKVWPVAIVMSVAAAFVTLVCLYQIFQRDGE
jgi:TRAP-type C4-dicarboxylate transport system permease small subunit